MDKRIQAKSISDEAFLAAIDKHSVRGQCWVMVWDVEAELGMPNKVVRAKAASLIRRGIIDGCPCGCRGDFRRMSWPSPLPQPAPKP